MDKLTTKSSSFEFAHGLRGLFSGNANPDTLWHMVLGFSAIIALGIGVFAYLTYTWAESSMTPLVTTSARKDTLSTEELQQVLDVYRFKQATYQALKNSRPTTPQLGINAGVVMTAPGTNVVPEKTEAPKLGEPQLLP